MNRFKILLIAVLLAPTLSYAGTLDDLLKKVQQEKVLQTEEYRKREAEFIQKRDQQKAMLKKAKAELNREERISAQLTVEFGKNEKKLTVLEDELNIAIGTLGEMFGVVKQVSGDLRGQFENSVVSSQIKGRKEFVSSLAESKVLPNIPKLERLWYELQREMTETGKVTQYSTTVVKPDGEKVDQKVTRVGSFNLVSDGRYLTYQPATGQIVELGRQPSRFTGLIDDLEGATSGYEAFAVDPSRGSLLSMLVRAPSFWERLQQGGLVGYVIIFLLFVGLGLVAERFVTLRKEDAKIKAQMASSTPSTDNALGTIMVAFEENKGKDLETLELKMDEAILKSTPPLERGIGTIKILAAVAPLLGLLGTVTGMIATFQSITLFGTGDPKLMAGGISQALITTVLGLVCAIPLLLLHNLVASRSKGMVQILEEESAGMMASRAEKGGKA